MSASLNGTLPSAVIQDIQQLVHFYVTTYLIPPHLCFLDNISLTLVIHSKYRRISRSVNQIQVDRSAEILLFAGDISLLYLYHRPARPSPIDIFTP
jgi:hypothetical protein